MKATKCTLLGRAKTFCPSAALLSALLVLILASSTTAAQTQVFVPGNASGFFGNTADIPIPFVPAITVSGPGWITVTYVNGTVTDCCGVNTGPNGVPWTWANNQSQAPLQERSGFVVKKITKLNALIGVFVPQSRVQKKGFSALDGTKGVTRVGIMPDGLFFIGTGKTFWVGQAGTLFLGINDCWVSDNGGGFTVTVTGP